MRSCDSCGKSLSESDLRFVLKMELYAAPEVTITTEDFQKDTELELKKMYEKMENMDPEALTEQVYVNYKLDLCKACRDTLNKRVKLREFV